MLLHMIMMGLQDVNSEILCPLLLHTDRISIEKRRPFLTQVPWPLRICTVCLVLF